MRSILRFVFVVVPTAALAAAVVFAVSGRAERVASFGGDLQRDLKLASTASIELAPVAGALATVSAIESPPTAAPERAVRPMRSRSGARAVRSRPPAVHAARDPQVAASADEAESVATDVAAVPGEVEAAAAAPGGVALPRPTAIPVAYPTGSGDAETYDPGPGTVIRGGTIDPDYCQIHGGRGRPVYGPPIYRQPRRGITLGDRVRAAQAGRDDERPAVGDRIRRTSTSGSRSSLGSRVREASPSRPRSEGSGRTLGDRVRAAKGG